MFNYTESSTVNKVDQPIIDHDALAYKAAQKTMVLLKNENNALPLNNKTVKSVALIGPNADATTVMMGNYMPSARFLISPHMGLSNYTTVNYVKGCEIDSTSKTGFSDAIKAA